MQSVKWREPMKLIFCAKCQDIVKLRRVKTYCGCKRCWGYYKKDGLNAVINHKAIPIGIDNISFCRAISFIEGEVDSMHGSLFTAFVIPRKDCNTIHVEKGDK